MGQIRHLRGRRWPLALTVSLFAHTVVMAAVGLTEWPPLRSEDPVDPIIVWISGWRPPPPEPIVPEKTEAVPDEAEAPQPDQPPPEPEEARADDETPATESEPDEEAAPSRSFKPIRRSIDWRAEARRAVVMARESRQQSDSYVSFGYPFEAREGLDSRTGESLAELEDRYGDGGVIPERDGNGDLVIYGDNGCYQIVGTGSILLEDANRFFNLLPMGGSRCPQPAGPRTDLFEAQKPEYLK